MMQEMSQSEIVKCSHKLVVNMCIFAVDSDDLYTSGTSLFVRNNGILTNFH